MIQDLFFLRKKSSIGQRAFRSENYIETIYIMETVPRMQLHRFTERRVSPCFSIILLDGAKSDIFSGARFSGATIKRSF